MFPGGPRGPGAPDGPTLPDSPCYWTQRQLVLVKRGQRLGASHMKVFNLLLEFGMRKYDIKLFHNFLNTFMGLTDEEIRFRVGCCVSTYHSTRTTRGTTISSSTRQTNESLKSKRTSGSRSTRKTLKQQHHISMHCG